MSVLTFPVENPISGDDIPRHFLPNIFAPTEVRALKIQGTGNFDFEIRYSPNANDQGAGTLLQAGSAIGNETTGVVFTGPYSDIPAGSWIWLELSNVATGLSRPVAVTVVVIGTESL